MEERRGRRRQREHRVRDDDVHTPEFTVTFSRAIEFNVVELREALPLGQRIEASVLVRPEYL
jgi:hypothetical protein